MFRHFFAAPDFLAMLRFWETSRAESGVAVWDGDLAKVPAELRPNLIVVDWPGTPRYRYIGSECVARFGRDTTGEALPTTLGGAYAAYICSLGDEVIARRQPIFSTSVFEVGDELMVSGRLFTPFSDAPDKPPGIIVSVHLFSRTAFKLSAVGGSGFVNESRRMLIPGVPELCAQLEAARRYHHVSRAVASRAQSAEWAELARRLSHDALVALQPFRAAIG
jgi:hypothetical protein